MIRNHLLTLFLASVLSFNAYAFDVEKTETLTVPDAAVEAIIDDHIDGLNLDVPAPGSGSDGDVVTVDSGAYVLAPPSVGGGRTALNADVTYYVRTDGNDSHDCSANTSGAACLTVQHVYDMIVSDIDLAGRNVIIQIADGTYSAGTAPVLSVSDAWTGGGTVTVRCNTTTPSNCIFQTSTAHVVAVTAGLPGDLTVEGFKGVSASGSILVHIGNGVLRYGNVEFGATAGYHIFASGTGAQIFCASNYTISGGAVHHWRPQNLAAIGCWARTITLTGTPAFTNFALANLGGMIEAYSNTYSGSATGQRYQAIGNSVIYTNGGTLPGNSAGATSNGGQAF